MAKVSPNASLAYMVKDKTGKWDHVLSTYGADRPIEAYILAYTNKGKRVIAAYQEPPDENNDRSEQVIERIIKLRSWRWDKAETKIACREDDKIFLQKYLMWSSTAEEIATLLKQGGFPEPKIKQESVTSATCSNIKRLFVLASSPVVLAVSLIQFSDFGGKIINIPYNIRRRVRDALKSKARSLGL